MSDPFTAFGSALYARLISTSGTAIYGSRVYQHLAPQNTGFERVVWNLVSGGDENETPNNTWEFLADVVVWGTAQANPRSAAAAIYSNLRDKPLSMAGYTMYWIRPEAHISLSDQEDGREYWGVGHTWRFRFHES
jgi:hypothetical protein